MEDVAFTNKRIIEIFGDTNMSPEDIAVISGRTGSEIKQILKVVA